MKKILGASIGSCVHVAGIINFLNLAKEHGYDTVFLGSACGFEKIKEAIEEVKPDIVAISYRLSPESASQLLVQFKEEIAEKYKKISFILGSTKPVAQKAQELKIFDMVFTGEETRDEVLDYIREGEKRRGPKKLPQSLAERVPFLFPFPLLRHHFGQPDLEDTIEGIKEISESKLIDVVSIGPDQNTQEFFFHPEKMDSAQDGAGGVPVRSEDDFKRLYEATRRGNYPLMRCYSGTNDIIRLAQVLAGNINNAWCAVPLCWYNELDNRSTRSIKDSIAENQQVMKWHAERGIPVEVNESHHWSLRYSPDTVAVAAAYLAAYNAKKMGVALYVSQYMFNTPPDTSFSMDLAKMLAKTELIESLHDDDFTSYRQTRSGLYSYPTDYDEGKGPLASSTMLQMQLSPHIVHVVAYCEADHVATPPDIIESAKIVKRVITNCLAGCPDMKADRKVQQRKKQLVSEACLIIEKIKSLGSGGGWDPLIDPEVIARAIKLGILDAPHLAGTAAGCGKVRTVFVNGANMAVDSRGRILSEKERLAAI